jgi:sulfur-oxidizing protein SoxA
MRIVDTIVVAAIIATCPAGAAEIPRAERRSGYSFMAPDTQAMQNDDSTNQHAVGARRRQTVEQQGRRSGQACAVPSGCARQHETSRRAIHFRQGTGAPVDLEQRINLCRVQQQQAPPFAYESRDLLALTALVARQSRGMPIETGADPQLASFVASGRDLYMQRQGQLNLACTNCHDDNWDKRLAGASITQGHPNGYPLYRLEWQSLGSLQRRLRACLSGIRAEPYDYGAPELVELELFLMSRARDMLIETPAVRP